MQRTSNTIRSNFSMGLALSADTCEALQLAADRRRERELVARTRSRKVPMSYQQRQALGARK